ncbi:hypothetical protein TSUD_363440 [Trifolium subterraneum]|uniref:Peptidase A1 domain-containing protein n=1 Tax=Trifolium subterraneum TaxID=3900 RepID=A0A2Z6MTP6_TRISU|nr:hypothetical protein TSUD_363440 [Trifolium subterraneum]
MTYSVGTPPFNIYGIVDTGSDIVWLQCEPYEQGYELCEQCYNQTTPIFNPSKSSSYKNIPCSSDLCKSVRGSSCNEQALCEYTIRYGDESHSEGDISIETLTLDSTTAIGCGHSNTGTFRGAASGIVGLGIGPMSLTTQLKSSIGGKFSYCLLPYSDKSNQTNKLNFGEATVVSGDGVVSTPLVKKDPPIFYYLTLEAFSVGNKRVEFGGSSEGGNEGNIIIDSGTTLTLLPDDVYTNLESAVVEQVKLDRVDDPNQIFSLCYSITSDDYDFPLITAHFKGADVQLHSISTFVKVGDGIVCFAFQSSKIGTIFGNLAQQNLLAGYDLQQNIVSFKATDCSKL